ncbi:MAG: WD40 repeat domain-containing protein [Myxococcales bacterium]|nr:WD40 repeat domain-containing protein [Myxococcales bacterium]
MSPAGAVLIADGSPRIESASSWPPLPVGAVARRDGADLLALFTGAGELLAVQRGPALGVTRARADATRARHGTAPLRGAPEQLVSAPGGRWFVVGTALGELALGRDVDGELQLTRLRAGGPSITALAIDPAGRALAVGTADGALRVRAVDDDLSPAPVELPERPAPISGLAFTPGGDALISVAGPDGQVERHPVLVDDDALVDALWRATRWCPSTARRVSWIGEAPESAARARARCRARATAR